MREEEKRQLFNAISIVGNISFNMVATLVVGIFLGRQLDNWLGSGPWGTVGGIVLGMISGLWATFRRAMHK